MKGFLHRNSLLLVVFFLFFCTFLFGQSLTGHRVYNEEQKEHGETEIALALRWRKSTDRNEPVPSTEKFAKS